MQILYYSRLIHIPTNLGRTSSEAAYGSVGSSKFHTETIWIRKYDVTRTMWQHVLTLIYGANEQKTKIRKARFTFYFSLLFFQLQHYIQEKVVISVMNLQPKIVCFWWNLNLTYSLWLTYMKTRIFFSYIKSFQLNPELHTPKVLQLLIRCLQDLKTSFPTAG